MEQDGHAREILQYVSEGYVFVDRHYVIRAMNAEGERLEGRPASEIIGKKLWEAWPQYTEGSPLREILEKVMRTREPAAMEQLSVRPWRDPIWLEVRTFPSRDGIAVYYRDISDRKRSEEELKRAEAELIHASRVSAMGAMASTLAHELSQPLAAASNYIEAAGTILRALPAAQAREAKQALFHAGAATHRASELLKRLRAFVSKGQVEAEVHDLQTIIADACVLLLPHAQREGVEIGFRLDRYARWVRADAVQIQQVLINLVRNAIEAMAKSPKKEVVIVTAAAPGGAVGITVEDSGPGLGDYAEDAIFVPFSSSKAKGMGVGLSISKTIVEAHGGTIGAAASPAGGAAFRFTLPRGVEPGVNAA